MDVKEIIDRLIQEGSDIDYHPSRILNNSDSSKAGKFDSWKKEVELVAKRYLAGNELYDELMKSLKPSSFAGTKTICNTLSIIAKYL